MVRETGLVRVNADKNNVVRITLNRPQRHNALVPQLLTDLQQALDDATTQAPKALLLCAEGPTFSTGGDVAEFFARKGAARQAYTRDLVAALNQVILTLLRFPAPTVAVVQGAVTGGSFGLVLACDLAVASSRATLAPWYSRVGFSPDGGWTALLPERIGAARALAIQLTNETLNARQAHDLGIFSHLSEADELASRTEAVVNDLLRAYPGSVAHTQALLRPDLETVRAGLDEEQKRFLEQIMTPEAEQGMADFLSRSGRTDNNKQRTGDAHGHV